MRLSFLPAKTFLVLWVEMLAERSPPPPMSNSSVDLLLTRYTIEYIELKELTYNSNK